MVTVFENDRIVVQVDGARNEVLITDKGTRNTKILVGTDASGLVAESHEYCSGSAHGNCQYLRAYGGG